MRMRRRHLVTSNTGLATQQAHISPNPNVIAQLLGDKLVLLHLQTDHFYELNHTAARLWQLLSEGCAPAEIQEQLAREFTVESSQLANEIDATLAALRQADLVGDYA